MLEIKLAFDIPLSTPEAALLRGCAPETLIRERVRGGDTAPFIRVGRAVRYPPKLFLAWMRNRPAVRSTSEVACSTGAESPAAVAQVGSGGAGGAGAGGSAKCRSPRRRRTHASPLMRTHAIQGADKGLLPRPTVLRDTALQVE